MVANKVLIILLLSVLISTAYWLLSSNLITPAPQVSFTTLSGKTIQLSQLQGKAVIVTFWATDCPSCIKEIPHLIELYNQFHPRGLEIIAIAMYYDPPSHVVYMTKAKKIPYHVTLDLKAEYAMAFGHVKLTPTTFFISPDGDIVMKKTGLLDIMDMKQRLENLG